MEDMVKKLRRSYEKVKQGDEDVRAVRDEARSALEEAKKRGNRMVVDEVADILLDLEFSAEENKCRCHQQCSCC